MRPKSNVEHKRQMIKKKNRAHWSMHKGEILTKRKEQKDGLKRLQKSIIGHDASNDKITIDNFEYLSLDGTSEVIGVERINELEIDFDFTSNYLDLDEQESDDDPDDVNEEQSNEEQIEEGLSEEQQKFGIQFIDHPESSASIEPFNELVSKSSRCCVLYVSYNLY